MNLWKIERGGVVVLSRYLSLIMLVSVISLCLACGEAKEVYNRAARADLMLADTYTSGYFYGGNTPSTPEDTIDIVDLYNEGFSESEGVRITIINNQRDNLLICSEHTKGDKVFFKGTNKKWSQKKDTGSTPPHLSSMTSLSCYEIGYRYGRCSTMSMRGLECDPEDDITVPRRCRSREDTQRGINAGVQSI